MYSEDHRMLKRSTIYLFFSSLLIILSTVAADARGSRLRQQEQASYLYLEGVRLQNLGAARQAARMFEAALRRVPQHAASYYRLSMLARDMSLPAEALVYARQAYLLDSTCTDYIDNYGRILSMTGNYAQAEPLFEKLLASDSSDFETMFLLAVLKNEATRYDEVLELIDTAEVRGGLRPAFVDLKRQALIRKERYSDAYDYMSEVCEQMPGNPTFRIQFAELAAALRRDSVALANYHTAIEIDSAALAPRLALAEYYRINDVWPDFLEALVPVFEHSDFPIQDKEQYFELYVKSRPDVYRQYFVYMARLANAALQAAPDGPKAKAFYAKHLLYSGQFDLAHRYLTDQITFGGAPIQCYRDVIELAQYREQPDTVTKYLALAEAQFPHSPELAMTKLYTQFQAGDTLAAIETAREAIRYSRNDSITSSAYGFCGDMAHLHGDNKSAYRYYEKALKLKPDSPIVLNNFAYYLSEEQRDLERALQMAEKANELEPQNATYIDTHAWVLYQLGRYEEAQTVMRRALVLDANNSSELLLHYGDILYALGQTFMAQTYWQRALEAGADGAVIEARLRQLGE